jgi:hypothetical protein
MHNYKTDPDVSSYNVEMEMETVSAETADC